MGKGAGCFPSKNKSPLIESDPNSNPNHSPIPEPITDDSIRSETTKPNNSTQTKKLRIFIVFYSMYGHIESLAKNIKKGVDEIEGVEGVLFRVSETLTPETLLAMKVPEKGDEIPVISAEELVEADGLLFGFPTRYGCMAAQMKAFFDSTGGLWREQKLAGVPAGFFVSSGTQGGGQETTA